MYGRRKYATNRRTYRQPYRKTPRRSYASAYIPSDYGGIRGAPADRSGRGFRGTYSRSQAEKKYIDIQSAAYECDTTGSVVALNLCDEGTSVSERIGRKICIKSVQIRGFLLPQDGQVSSASCRVMLVWDKQVNGVIATIAEILSASTSHSFMNLDNRERFVVLMDKMFSFGISDTTMPLGNGPSTAVVNKYKKMPEGSFTIFDGTGGGIADVNTGALYLVTIGNNQAGLGRNLVAATRVRYTDS